jgi:hypothetical protein
MGLLFSRIFSGLFGSKVTTFLAQLVSFFVSVNSYRGAACFVPSHFCFRFCVFEIFWFLTYCACKNSSFVCSQEVRILILGLDNAGKTTILNKLHSPDKVLTFFHRTRNFVEVFLTRFLLFVLCRLQIIRTTPTIGFNVEKVVHKNINFVLWDLGGQSNIRYCSFDF